MEKLQTHYIGARGANESGFTMARFKKEGDGAPS
jgi:hypothetical protein